eukprot:scaffold73333_cov33-Prasinocladus_malaysianus.AAC.1
MIIDNNRGSDTDGGDHDHNLMIEWCMLTVMYYHREVAIASCIHVVVAVAVCPMIVMLNENMSGPFKLTKNGWAGNYALGSSYIALPWWAGQALFGELTLDVMVLTVLYSLAGLGIAIVNDFKSIEGDRWGPIVPNQMFILVSRAGL